MLQLQNNVSNNIIINNELIAEIKIKNQTLDLSRFTRLISAIFYRNFTFVVKPFNYHK